MANSEEEIMIRLGFKADAVTRGTQAMLDQQKKSALDYVAFWKKSTDEREALETRLTEKFIAQIKIREDAEKASLAKRMAAAETFAANNTPERVAIRARTQKAVEDDIAKGSGAFGSLEKEAAAGAVGAAAGAAVSHGANTSIFREIQVLLHEGIAGRWKQFVSSFSRLLMFMGLTAETLVSGIPIIGTAAAAIFGNLSMRKSLAEQAGGYGTIQASQETAEIIGKRLAEEIGKLQAAGKLTDAQAGGLRNALGTRTIGGVESVQRALAGLLPQGFATPLPSIDEQKKKADALAASEQKQLDELLNKKRDEFDVEKNIAWKNEEIALLKKQMAGMDKDSLAYHQANADLIGYELQLEKDKTQQAEQQKDLAEKTKQWQEWSGHAARDYMRGQIEAAMDEAEYPTIAELAGRRFTSRLDKMYGKGGIYDLGGGNNPYAANAQDYLLAQKQQIWDREHGNNGAADQDRLRMVAERNYLVDQGVASPQMMLSKIGENTSKLHELWSALVKSGALQTTIVDQP